MGSATSVPAITPLLSENDKENLVWLGFMLW